MGYQPPLPNSSRLIDWGHSWVAPPLTPYAVSNAASDPYPADGEQWPNALRDALGVGTSGAAYTKTYIVPASTAVAASADIFLDTIPGDATIEAVWYTPSATITGANTNSKTLGIGYGDQLGTLSLSSVAFLSGVNATANVPLQIWNINAYQNAIGGANFTNIGLPPYFPAVRYGLATTGGIAQEVFWRMTKVGTGLADPGGVVTIRYGTRYRNYAVSGSCLQGNNPYFGVGSFGSWWTLFSYSAYARPNAPEVNVRTAAAAHATSILCTALQYPIASGWTILFNNGVRATANGNALLGATSIAVNDIGATGIPIGSQGHVSAVAGTPAGGYESLSPVGIFVNTHGYNDVGSLAQDNTAWAECVRAAIARECCPHLSYPLQANWQTSNDGGTWTSAPVNPTLPGSMPITYNNWGYDLFTSWAGTSPTTSDSVSIILGPAFEGGTVDLFLLAVAGAGYGVSGLITVDGSVPAQGTFAASSTANSGATITFSTANAAHVTIGMACTGPGSAGTLVTGVNYSTGVVTLASGTPSGGSYTFAGLGFNTESVSTTANAVKTLTGTVSTSGSSTTLTSSTSNFAQTDVGRVVTATGIGAGNVIQTVAANGSTAVLATAVTVSATTCTTSSYVPMVKRITGLSSGAHTIKVTITAATGANSWLLIHGLGLESQNPQTPVLWANIAASPAFSGGQVTIAQAYNTISSAVIAGTQAPLGGNTAEPAFAGNVQLVDIYTAFGGASPGTSLFLPDGVHPNTAGHRVMSRILFSTIRNNFSPDQLISR